MELHAEAATDVRRDDHHAVLLDPQRSGEDGAVQVRRLARDPHREIAAVAIERREHRSTFERRGGVSRHREGRFDDRVRDGERGVGIAGEDLAAGHHVVRPAVVQPGRGGRHRLVDVDDGGQGIVGHVHALEGVLGRIPAFRHHRGDGLADVDHLVGGQDEKGVLARARGLDEHRERAEGCDVLDAEHHHHAGQPPGLLEVTRDDACVSVWASQHRHVQHARSHQVSDVGALALHQPWIFLAMERAADETSGRCCRHHASSAIASHVRAGTPRRDGAPPSPCRPRRGAAGSPPRSACAGPGSDCGSWDRSGTARAGCRS